jgi:glutaredoxin
MKKVKVYGYSSCPYCTQLKKLLDEMGITFIDVDITKEENFAEFETIVSVTKHSDLPIVSVGHQLLIPDVSFKSIPDCAKLTKSLLT